MANRLFLLDFVKFGKFLGNTIKISGYLQRFPIIFIAPDIFHFYAHLFYYRIFPIYKLDDEYVYQLF